MVEAPGKQLLIEKLKKREKQAAAQGEGQEKPPGSAPKEKQHKKEG